MSGHGRTHDSQSDESYFAHDQRSFASFSILDLRITFNDLSMQTGNSVNHSSAGRQLAKELVRLGRIFKRQDQPHRAGSDFVGSGGGICLGEHQKLLSLIRVSNWVSSTQYPILTFYETVKKKT